MIIAFDTTFFVLHYFSNEESILNKTQKIFTECRKLGNKGILPTIVLGEFYALVRKKTGRDIAEKYFRELINSGLNIINLTIDIAKQAGIFRHKYKEKLPWGDCIIAATAFLEDAEILLTEDPHFKQFREIKARTLAEIKI
ncbi:MAG: PIN domain-containing protein [Candidatus Bathyarchaeota archaeon]|jgi:predicted nucleic acid-binding protein|nr:PIN domain-containing protein [Candidatus Bathyarchaeota archaeon A05DMB-3]MDH7607484.1 PIN domain-containing protein [Candidatus Bathyarchaeota archaeon]